MSPSESDVWLIVELVDDFLDRYRKGERPPLTEYIDRHPELTAEIREVFPAIAVLEQIATGCSLRPDGRLTVAPANSRRKRTRESMTAHLRVLDPFSR